MTTTTKPYISAHQPTMPGARLTLQTEGEGVSILIAALRAYEGRAAEMASMSDLYSHIGDLGDIARDLRVAVENEQARFAAYMADRESAEDEGR